MLPTGRLTGPDWRDGKINHANGNQKKLE